MRSNHELKGTPQRNVTLADMIENGEDVPFGDKVQTDNAALAAFLGEQRGENKQSGSRDTGEGAGEQAQEGAERGTRTGGAAQGDERPLLQSHTSAEVLAKETRARLLKRPLFAGTHSKAQMALVYLLL